MRIGDLEVDIPSAWEDHSLYSFVAPPEVVSPEKTVKQAPFRKNLVMQRHAVPEDATLDDRVQGVVKATERDFGQAVKVDVEDGPLAAGSKTRRVVYKVVDPVTNQPVAQVLYVLLHGGFEWQIAFSTPALTLKAAQAEFDAVVASIRPA